MDPMTELILVRHGETDWNRELRFQGHVDVGLNATGLEQARRVASRLAGEPARHLYVSDLLRAQQTAQPIAQELAVATVADVALREQAFGVVDGMRVDDIKSQHPQAWEGWLRFHEDYSMPGGETMRQFHARVMDAVYRTARSLPLSGPRRSEIPNAGVSRVVVSGSGIEILSWADTSHLADLPPQPVYDQLRLLAAEGPRSA